MRSPSVPPRYLLIDIDNCLVPYDKNYVPYVTDVIIDTVLELDNEAYRVFKGDRDLVARLADHYYKQYGQSIYGFAKEHHFSVSALSRHYHENLDPDKCVNPTRDDLARLYDFKKWLQDAKRTGLITDYVAFTQSTDIWAKKILFDKLSLHGTFNCQNIVSATTYGFGFKDRDFPPYMIARRRMNASVPIECLVIDDSKSVLRHAFDRMGMQTCLVSHEAIVAPEHQSYLSGVVNHIGDVPRLVAELSR